MRFYALISAATGTTALTHFCTALMLRRQTRPQATNWLLDLTTAADDPTVVLADVVEASWLPLAQRAPIYQRILQAKQDAVSKSEGLQKEGGATGRCAHGRYDGSNTWSRRGSIRDGWRRDCRAFARKAALWKRRPLFRSNYRLRRRWELSIPKYEAIAQIRRPRPLWRFCGLRRGSFLIPETSNQRASCWSFVLPERSKSTGSTSANFLGLAEIRIAAGDTPGAVDLLRRLVVVVGNPFENLDPAAALLEKTGHYAEAIEFLDQLVKASPWEPAYRLRLAKAKVAAGQDVDSAQKALTAIASGPDVAYAVRTQAALASGRHASSRGTRKRGIKFACRRPGCDQRFLGGPALLLRCPAASRPVFQLTHM